jgi:hypothetical protein
MIIQGTPHNNSLQRTGSCPPLSFIVVEDASRLDNAADEENPLIVRRKVPHNQRIEQTPFGRSSFAALCINDI